MRKSDLMCGSVAILSGCSCPNAETVCYMTCAAAAHCASGGDGPAHAERCRGADNEGAGKGDPAGRAGGRDCRGAPPQHRHLRGEQPPAPKPDLPDLAFHQRNGCCCDLATIGPYFTSAPLVSRCVSVGIKVLAVRLASSSSHM